MCIRDRARRHRPAARAARALLGARDADRRHHDLPRLPGACLLYTSDAADERSSVDLGGRRIIKKKKRTQIRGARIVAERTLLVRQTTLSTK